MNQTDIKNSIKNNNAKFKSLSKAEKRVAVTKDAMAQLLLGRYIGTSGTYIGFSPGGDCDLVKQAELEPCTVCGIGSLMLSTIRKTGENITVMGSRIQRGLWFEESDEEFTVAFPSRMLREIERTFEVDFEENECSENTISAIKNEDVRLFAILENIIENNGNFKQPPRKPRYTEDSGNEIVYPEFVKFEAAITRRFDKARTAALKVAA